MKKTYYIFLFVLLCKLSYAQLGKEAWHWVMGGGNSIDFNTGTAVQGTFSTTNPCLPASISDPNTGQLLFYAIEPNINSNYAVFDRNHIQMPNGYLNTVVSRSLIIPFPCGYKYYLITFRDTTLLTYSIIDMSLRGGLGDVIQKNIPFPYPHKPVKVLGIKHGNQKDYWFVTHDLYSNTFYSYLIDQNGISSTPVISNVGTSLMLNSLTWVSNSYLKASPDGKRLALVWAGTIPSIIELYDFNNTTGVITNPITLSFTQPKIPFGVSFSPDNTKLYATFPFGGTGGIAQFDLTSNNAATIQASIYQVTPFNGNGFVEMQMGPDGKIYVFGGNIVVINSPNNIGTSCNPTYSNINSNFPPNYMDGGVNPITHAYFSKTNAIDTGYCLNGGITLGGNYNGSNFNWSTGANTQTITINSIGKYWVTYTNAGGCDMHDTFKVSIQPHPKINLGSDTSFCLANKTLNAYNPNSSYLWNTGQKSNSIQATQAGTYWVQVSERGCVGSDTVHLYNSIDITYPNIITPNGDNINDFINFGSNLFSSFHIDIHNRWGKKVYTSDDILCLWYPAETDDILEDGTYYYVAEISLSCGDNNQTKVVKGFITLIK